MAVRISGLGAVTAFGRGLDALWQGLLEGHIALRPPRRIDTSDLDVCAAGEIDEPTPPEADRALFFAKIAAEEAIGSAGWSRAALSDPRTALIVATTKGGIGLAQRVLDANIAPEHLIRFPLFVLARALAEDLGMCGTTETLSIACASGIAAAGHARALLESGRADRALVVGADALSEFIWRGFLSLRALDPRGARPFDKDRNGLTVGEGAAALTLERGEGRACAWLEGSGASNDAHHITGPSREGAGLASAVERALEDAGRSSEAIDAICSHGTGTRYNDASEAKAYRRVFGERRIPVHANKGAIGHLLGGAGLVNIAVAARALEEGVWPGVPGLVERDPELELAAEKQPTAIDARAALVCAAGFGGVNAAVVLAPPATRTRPRPKKERIPAVIAAAQMIDLSRESLVAQAGAAARRLDELCLAGLSATRAAFRAAGLTREDVARADHAFILGTALGCLESDYAYYSAPKSAANPRIFAYTLPNIVLGEVAIAEQLTGEHWVITAGRVSALTALAEGAAMIESGRKSVVIVLAIDVVGAAAARLYTEAVRTEPIACAAGIVLESEDHLRARGGSARARILRHECGIGPIGGPLPLRDPLGCSGVRELCSLESHGASRTVAITAECPAGYRARIEVSVA